MVHRYHSEAAHDWALPNSSDGGSTNESPWTVQKGRNSIDHGQKSAEGEQLDPLDEEEEMMRRVNTVITSAPSAGQKPFYHRPDKPSNRPAEGQPADAPKGSIMLAMTLDQLREIVREEVKERPLAPAGRPGNPRVAWNDDGDETKGEVRMSPSGAGCQERVELTAACYRKSFRACPVRKSQGGRWELPASQKRWKRQLQSAAAVIGTLPIPPVDFAGRLQSCRQLD
eukprot:3483513-Rhodomonas_salina.3